MCHVALNSWSYQNSQILNGKLHWTLPGAQQNTANVLKALLVHVRWFSVLWYYSALSSCFATFDRYQLFEKLRMCFLGIKVWQGCIYGSLVIWHGKRKTVLPMLKSCTHFPENLLWVWNCVTYLRISMVLFAMKIPQYTKNSERLLRTWSA